MPGHAREVHRLVPQDLGLGAGDPQGVDRVDVPVGAREQDDADPDAHPPSPATAGASASPSASTSNRSISGFDSRSRGEPVDDRAGRGLVVGGDAHLHPAADADAGDAGDPEVREAALHGLALRVQDAGLGGDVDGEAVGAGELAHRAMTSSMR